MYFRQILLFSLFAQAAQENATEPPTDVEYEKPNWTIATTTGDVRETRYYPAYYIDLSPCPCDLSPNRCDLFCCCDALCDEEAKRSLFANCTAADGTSNNQAVAGGILTRFGEYFHIFLEVHYITTPVLGYFYANVPESARSMDAYSELTSKTTSLSGFADKDYVPQNELTSPSSVNKFGDMVRIEESYAALPSSSLDDRSCTFRSAIHFMKNSNTTCIKSVTQLSCASDPALNAVSYLHIPLPSSSTVFPFDNSSIPLFAEPSEFASVGTRRVYFCKNSIADIHSVRSKDCQQLDTDVGPPSLNNASNICSGLVATVVYTFYWSGRQIMHSSEIFLTDVPLGAELSQLFTVTWTHQIDPSLSANATSTRRTWSGYIWDDMIYGISNPFNNTAVLQSTNTPTTVRPVPLLTSTGPDNLCPYTTDFGKALEGIKFGFNVDAGCYINISKDQFRDCDRLREAVMKNWHVLFDGIRFIPKYAYSSLARSQDENSPVGVDEVVQLLRRNFSDTDEIPTPSLPDDMQSDVHNENLTQNLLAEYQKLLNHKPGIPDYQVHSRLPFACSKSPWSAHLDIMYAEAAYVNVSYLNVIVGAFLSLQYTTWRFSSRFESDQRFLLKQSVRFIKVPAAEPQPVEKYYLMERRDHCPSAVTCWDELFYPFLDWAPVEMYPYAKAVGFVAVLFVGSVSAVVRPWL